MRAVTARILDGRAVSAEIRSEVSERVRALSEKGVTPGLAAVLVGDDQASRIYVGAKHKACADVGHPSRADRSARLRHRGRAARDDPPAEPRPRDPRDHRAAPDAGRPARARGAAHDRHREGRRRPASLERRDDGPGRGHVPARTPYGIVELLLRRGIELESAEVVVVGHGDLVGVPLSIMLAQDSIRGNATVTSTHVKTRDLAAHTRRADILVAAAGRAADDHAPTWSSPAPPSSTSACIAPSGGLVGDVAHRRGGRCRRRDHPGPRRGRADDRRDAAGEHRDGRGATGLHSVSADTGRGGGSAASSAPAPSR